MKEVNEFPNIKPAKLKEEINKNNTKNSLKSKNFKILKYKGFNYCLLYLLIFSFVIFLFIFNYIKTKDVFKDNKFIILPSEKLCNKALKLLEQCLKEKPLLKCNFENKEVEICYDESYIFNQVCFVYISDFDLCLRKNNNDYKKCENYLNEILKCGSFYRHLKVEKDNLIKIVNEYY